MSEMKETLIPQVVTVTDIRVETPDIKTFRVVTPDGKKPFEHIPGQCAMLSVPGRQRGDDFHHLFADQKGIHGIQH